MVTPVTPVNIEPVESNAVLESKQVTPIAISVAVEVHSAPELKEKEEIPDAKGEKEAQTSLQPETEVKSSLKEEVVDVKGVTSESTVLRYQ
jgi:hypothetical protein